MVGVGSLSGDDALGWEVLRQLRDRIGDRPGIDWHTIDGGHRLLELLDGQGSLLLIDALTTGATPGTIHRLDWPDPRAELLAPGSTHAMRPAESLQLAATLGLLPPRVVVFGIEAAGMEPGAGLSAAAAAAAPLLVAQVADELTDGN